jgi:hypothetical protein
MSKAPLIALLLLAAFPVSGADPAPAPVPAPMPGPADATVHKTSEYQNTAYYDAIKAFAKAKGWGVKEEGTGNVRALLIGGAQTELKKSLELANKCLEGLEMWTGQQESFITAKNPAPGEVYWLTVFASGDQVGAWIDFLREKKALPPPEAGQEDLMKKLLAFPGPRMMYTPVEKVQKCPDEWAVYSTACMAFDAYYGARQAQDRPSWMREGLAAEMQRVLCKRILCTTIAYEDKQFPMSESWGSDVARLIRSNDKQNKAATELMRMSLEGLPNVFYQQMWSLCAFVEEASGGQKGPKNKLHRILELTAGGETSEKAFKEVFGKADPALTQAWRQWALTQK